MLTWPLRVGVFVLLLSTFSLPAGFAQDWDVERGDLKDKKIDRYKELVERSAEESYAFKQLMKTVGRGPDYDKLVAEYRAKVDSKPDDYILRMLLGHMLRYGGRASEALTEYEAAVKLDETALAWESVGLAHEANKSADDAVSAFEKALGLAKDREQKERLLRSLGSTALHRRHLDKAKEYFTKLVELDPKDLFLRKELAHLLIENKFYPEALEQLQAAVDIAGRNVQQRTQLMLDIGEVYELQGKDDEAIEIYRDAAGNASGDSWLQTEVEERVIGIYRRQNKIDKLVAYYEESWRSPSFEQLMILARLYEEMGNDAKAIELVNKAIKSSPKNPDARAKLLQILERSGDTKAVIAAYRDTIKALPGESGYRFELAELLYRTQDQEEALKVLSQLSKSFKSDVSVHVKLADKYLSWDKRELALEEYKLLVKIAPSDPVHLESLGEFYYQTGKKDLALETWNKILKVVQGEAEARAYLGRVLGDHGMMDDAVKEYKAAIALLPDKLQLVRDLAELYERGRQFNDAISTWETVLEKSSDRMLRREARQHIISILHQQGTLRASLYQFERQFEGPTPDLEAGFFLSEAYLKLGEPDEAARILESILQSKPDELDALLALEKVYDDQGNHEKSIALLQRLVELDSARSRVYLQKIADAYLRLGKPDEAEQFMIETLRVNANDSRSYAKLGDVYRKKQQYEKAAEMYEQAIDVDARAFDHYLVLAEIYAQMHRDLDADKLYRIVAQQAMDEAMVLRAARRSIDFNAFMGSLDGLETDFAPLLHKTPRRPVYGKIMVELYVARCQGLIALARSGTREQAEAARAELQEIGRRAIKPLLDALNEDDQTVKLLALDLLGEIGNANATLHLSLLLDDPDRKLQARAALALSRLAEARTLPFLVKASSASYERRIRELAVWGLGRIDTPEARAELERLTSTNFISLRALAALGLGRAGEGRDSLLKLVKNDSATLVRSAAAFALAQAGDATAIPALLEMLRSESEPQAAAMAAWALGAVGDERALSPLLEAYWSEKPELREVAGAALLRWAAKPSLAVPRSLWEENASFININAEDSRFDVAALLQDLLREQMRQVDTGAAQLVNAHADALRSAIRAQLTSAEGRTAMLVLRDLDQGGGIFAQLGDAEFKALLSPLSSELRSLLSGKDNALRGHAASLLGRLGASEAVPELLVLLSGEASAETKRRVILALGQIGSADAYAPLALVLSNGSFGERAYAAWALGMLGELKAYDALLDALDDDYTFVAAMAARGLGELADPRTVELFVSRIEKVPPSVQAEMVKVLVKQGAAERIEHLRSSVHVAVREAFDAPE
jgi:tetratricopeptide (TPR) repeat protein